MKSAVRSYRTDSQGTRWGLRRVSKHASAMLVAMLVGLTFTACDSGGDGGDDGESDRGPTSATALITATEATGGAAHLGGVERYASIWVGPVCARGVGEIAIRDVEPVGAEGGLQVTGFVVSPPQPSITGFVPRRLSSLYSAPAKAVTARCPRGAEDPEAIEVADDLTLELYKPTRASASVREFRVTYSDGAATRTAVVPVAIRLCEEALGSPSCKAPVATDPTG